MITNFKKLAKVRPLALKMSRFETGWDLGPSAAVFAPGQMSPQATKYEETIRD